LLIAGQRSPARQIQTERRKTQELLVFGEVNHSVNLWISESLDWTPTLLEYQRERLNNHAQVQLPGHRPWSVPRIHLVVPSAAADFLFHPGTAPPQPVDLEKEVANMKADYQTLLNQLTGTHEMLEQLLDKDVGQRKDVTSKPRISPQDAEVLFKHMLPQGLDDTNPWNSDI
jgi:hypothetical protein